MVYKFFDKKYSDDGVTHANKTTIKSEMKLNLQLAEEIQQPIIRKYEKRKLYSSFKDNVLGTDLVDMQLISKYDKDFQLLLCVINMLSICAWLFLGKIKRYYNAFQKILDESNLKPNKIWVDKGSSFYNRSVKSWLQD